MSIFPKVTSPCPYKGNLSDIMDGDICRLCKKEVFDLDALDDGERMALVANCPDTLCVSYSVPAKSAIAAMAIGAAVVAMPVAAQDSQDSVEAWDDQFVIIVGGLPRKDKVAWTKDVPEYSAPALPVIYEDDTAKKPVPRKAKQASQTKVKPAGS